MDPEARERMLAGSRAGSRAVSQEFGEKLTRKRFCQEVGIHPTTLRRWESAGVVSPNFETVLGSRTAVFEQADLDRGKRIASLLKDNPGEMSLSRAAWMLDQQNDDWTRP